MIKPLKTPDSEEFSKLVETYEKKYGEYDRIYRYTLKKFETVRLHDLSEDDIKYILNPYFLKWGKMARVLGFKGCEMLGNKLKAMNTQLEKFRQEDLSTVDLTKMDSEIANIYDEIMNTKWVSKKGREKRLGPTSTSKALHLVAPNLFMIWDRAIRNYYGLKENSKEYIRFLTNMRNWFKELKPTIERLQQRYKKSCTKIIDEYNWMKSRE